MAATLPQILLQYWGHDQFRPLQQDIIKTVLGGEDCLALLPTGGGKSICFQLPAIAMEGLCLVVSPLIALMKDQVENLRKKNITAFAIYSGMSRKEVIHTLEVAGNSNCRLLYVSPERLGTKLFNEFLPSLGVKLIAVDEAHCISQWGYDFRPSYLQIARLREELPQVPILAVTASATPDVQKDITDKLQFGSHKIFRSSFERANLSYSVFEVPVPVIKITEILKKVEGSAIVYCRSRKRTRELSRLLQQEGFTADYYHAGLTSEERSSRQEAWIQNRIRVIVCTNAFGMGIDKPDVRIVVHAGVPDCLENYYQEAGRAGRDGGRSYAVLLYGHREKEDLEQLVALKFPEKEKVREIYQALMNYLQIPAGSGEGNEYEFDLSDFCRRFNLDAFSVTATLHLLEQEGWMYFSEQAFSPSTLWVHADRKMLEAAELQFPSLDPLLKMLLRNYEGITDGDIKISESYLSYLLRSNEETVSGQLEELHRHGVLRYSPRKERPMVFLQADRVIGSDLQWDEQRFRKRRDQYDARVRAMKDYIEDTGSCRSRIIAGYFGDDGLKDCGICDNCLNKKKMPLADVHAGQLINEMMSLLESGDRTLEELKISLRRPAHQLRELIGFLVSESLIEIRSNGSIGTKQVRK